MFVCCMCLWMHVCTYICILHVSMSVLCAVYPHVCYSCMQLCLCVLCALCCYAMYVFTTVVCDCVFRTCDVMLYGLTHVVRIILCCIRVLCCYVGVCVCVLICVMYASWNRHFLHNRLLVLAHSRVLLSSKIKNFSYKFSKTLSPVFAVVSCSRH